MAAVVLMAQTFCNLVQIIRSRLRAVLHEPISTFPSFAPFQILHIPPAETNADYENEQSQLQRTVAGRTC